MNLFAKKRFAAVLILTAIFFPSQKLLAQREGNRTANPNATTEVEQAIRNFYKALYSDDKETVVSFLLDESFFYQPGYPLETGKSTKMRLQYSMDQGRINAPYSYEVADFTILMIGNDAAVAHYRVEAKSLKDPKDQERYLVTDTLVRRNSRWQILAEDTSPTPRPPERIIAGLPSGWERSTTAASANNYIITLDTSTKHDGNASASIKFGCGNDEDSWTTLLQAIAADDYRGKRIRLTGWLRTADATHGGFFMRVDTFRGAIALDNMDNRPVQGTTDWKMYSIVLDVPTAATEIVFGPILGGKGQLWVDDFKLEIVDNSIASTNINGLADAWEEQQPPRSKPTAAANKRPVNLGFENGVVH